MPPPGASNWGAASNFARTVGKPLSRRDFLTKNPNDVRPQPFKGNYRKYLNWWQRKNPDWKQEYGYQRRAAAAAPKATTTTASPFSGGGSAVATGTANPWDVYTRSLDKREQDEMERMVRARTQAGIDLFAAMRGFGDAASSASADAWGRALGGFQRGAETQGAMQSAVADDYTLGLQQANQQIARDFAAVGQGTPAEIRDTDAATKQVQTVGGENPAALIGLVGKNWESYAETVPGQMSFMQEQNLNQARREAVADTDRIISEWQEKFGDNEETAMGMWQAVQKWQWEKADRATTKVEKTAAAKQAARAFELQVQAFNLKYGDVKAQQAKELAETTGYVHVWNPKTGKFDRTDQKTEKAREADARNTTTLRGQTLSAAAQKASRMSREEIARLGRELKLDLAKITKDENAAASLTPNRRSKLAQTAGEMVKKGFFGSTYKDGTQKDPKQQAETVLMQMRGMHIPLSIALDAIAQYAWAKDSPWAYARTWRRKPGSKPVPVAQGAANSPH